MPDTFIRKAAQHEVDTLSALAFRSKAHWGYSSAFMEACRAELTYGRNHLKTRHVYVLELTGQILGFYALKQHSGDRVELEALFVEPSWIGQGVGRRLIDHAKALARQLGAGVMIIESDPNAVAFYIRAGARQTGHQPSGSIAGRVLPTFEIDLN
jgi:GNAT superfamily N-acetyltransferase